MKTIALANQKGGVGKTTTAASLGIGLAQQGKKVLLVDADAQGNLTQMLGWRQPDELSPTLADLMTKTVNEEPIAPGEGILHHASGVDLVPANIELSGLEVTLVNIMSRETVLRQYLSTLASAYDYAIIDCMPSLGMLTINALTAADSVIIPVQGQYLAAKGLEQLRGDEAEAAEKQSSQPAVCAGGCHQQDVSQVPRGDAGTPCRVQRGYCHGQGAYRAQRGRFLPYDAGGQGLYREKGGRRGTTGYVLEYVDAGADAGRLLPRPGAGTVL